MKWRNFHHWIWLIAILSTAHVTAHAEIIGMWLFEEGKGKVAQAEHTVLLMKDEKIVTTRD